MSELIDAVMAIARFAVVVFVASIIIGFSQRWLKKKLGEAFISNVNYVTVFTTVLFVFGYLLVHMP